jgi:hypothetical protein
MSITAIVVLVYFAIGLLVMTVVIASGKKGGRTDITPIGGDDPIGSGLFVFIILLWPIWFLLEMAEPDEKPKEPRTQKKRNETYSEPNKKDA